VAAQRGHEELSRLLDNDTNLNLDCGLRHYLAPIIEEAQGDYEKILQLLID
jgi:hypothetical protein